MNLSVTDAAEKVYSDLAKVNKRVHKGTLPWYAIFVIAGESIDVATAFPSNDSEKEDITVDNWVSKIWEPLSDIIRTQYAKNACYVAVEILYTNEEGNEVSAPIFFKWCPDSGVPLRTKMMIGSSFQSAKKKLDVLNTTPELSQASQLEINTFAADAKLKGWVNK